MVGEEQARSLNLMAQTFPSRIPIIRPRGTAPITRPPSNSSPTTASHSDPRLHCLADIRLPSPQFRVRSCPRSHCLVLPFAFQIDKLATQAVVAYQPFLYGRPDRSTDDGSGARFCTNETRWRNAGSNQAPSLESGALAQFILSLPWYHRLRSVCES